MVIPRSTSTFVLRVLLIEDMHSFSSRIHDFPHEIRPSLPTRYRQFNKNDKKALMRNIVNIRVMRADQDTCMS